MITKQKVDFTNFSQKLLDFQEALKKHAPGLVSAYLFGSSAQGDMKPLSDIDIALLFDKAVEYKFIETNILIDAMRILGTEEIDLVVLNEAPLHLRYSILRNKRIIFCSDPIKRVNFETDSIMEYLDFRHIRQLYNREFLRKIKVGGAI